MITSIAPPSTSALLPSISPNLRPIRIAITTITAVVEMCIRDSIETAINKYGKNECRHAIEHLELVDDADFDRIREFGVIPSVQPEHLALTQTFAANPYPEVLGKKRADKTLDVYKRQL